MSKKKIKNSSSNVLSFKSVCEYYLEIYKNLAPDNSQSKIENVNYDVVNNYYSLGDFDKIVVEYKKNIDSGVIQTVEIVIPFSGEQTPTALDNEEVWDFIARPGTTYGSDVVSRYLSFREKTFTIDNCLNEGRDHGTIIANDNLIITRITALIKNKQKKIVESEN